MRQHKQSGAWMSDYRSQSRTGSIDGSSVLPIIVNNNNFAKGSEVSPYHPYIAQSSRLCCIVMPCPQHHYWELFPPALHLPFDYSHLQFHSELTHTIPQGAPTLLSFDDARTLFHEFGYVSLTHHFIHSSTLPHSNSSGLISMIERILTFTTFSPTLSLLSFNLPSICQARHARHAVRCHVPETCWHLCSNGLRGAALPAVRALAFWARSAQETCECLSVQRRYHTLQ